MEKLSKKEMIEKLANYRKTSDKLADDIFSIQDKLFPLMESLQLKENRTEFEEKIFEQLGGMAELLLQSSLDVHAYSNSMWSDYTNVIKSLGGKGLNNED